MKNMKKEEKEAIVNEYTKYWTLANAVRDIVLNALNELPMTDIISVLDRVKTELVQHGAMIALEEEMQSDVEETSEEVSDEIVNQRIIEHKLSDTKAGRMLGDIENMGEIGKEMNERINS